MFAELAVRDPRRTVLVRLERERVDQDGPAVAELDVERRGVAQGPAVGERIELGVEREERRVAQLPERPLVRVADEVDRLGSDQRVGARRLGEIEGCCFVGEEPPPFDQPRFKRAPGEPVPLGRETLLDLAVRASVEPEDEPAGVAERASGPAQLVLPDQPPRAASSADEAGVEVEADVEVDEVVVDVVDSS